MKYVVAFLCSLRDICSCFQEEFQYFHRTRPHCVHQRCQSFLVIALIQQFLLRVQFYQLMEGGRAVSTTHKGKEDGNGEGRRGRRKGMGKGEGEGGGK